MDQQDVTFEPARAAEYELTLSVGDPASPDGLTRVSLDGSGKFVANVVREEPESKEVGEPEYAKPAEVKPLVGEMLSEAEGILRKVSQFPWSRPFPSRPGIPDEAIVIWQFGRKGEKPATLKVWLREAESDPALAPVLKALREELARLSEGHLYL